jgi:hypothetical protein
VITDSNDSVLAKEVLPNFWRVYNHYEKHYDQDHPFVIFTNSRDEDEVRKYAERRWQEYAKSKMIKRTITLCNLIFWLEMDT